MGNKFRTSVKINKYLQLQEKINVFNFSASTDVMYVGKHYIYTKTLCKHKRTLYWKNK